MKYLFFVALVSFGIGTSYSQPIQVTTVVNTYPVNGARHVQPLTGIGITFSSPLQKASVTIDSITVSGKLGKKYTGTLRLTRSGRTIIFTPSAAFAYCDLIHACFGEFETISGAKTPAFSLSFSIKRKRILPDTGFHSDDPVLELQLHREFQSSSFFSENKNAHLAPQDLPQRNILIENNPSDGMMFLTNYRYVSQQSNTYRMILDKYGEAINCYGGGPDYFSDFKPNPNGTYSFYDYQNQAFFILDSTLRLRNIISASNGYVTDAHEIRVTSEGNYFLIAADYVFVDMSSQVLGGWQQATVLVPIIQEFDRDSNLIFEWRSIDHFKVTDATHEDLALNYIDFCHINAIEFDTDSNLLISSRNMDEITKINRETGDVIWRWGGKNNQFTFAGDTLQFSHQHSIRRTDAGTYIMLDNGNFHAGKAAYSRAVEYRLDQTNKIATRIWEFRHKPDILSLAMGSVQRLPNQHTFIGWGESDNVSVTELDSNNQTLYEMGMTDGNYSYRAYKYDSGFIHGTITNAVAQSSPAENITLTCTPNPVAGQAHIECSVTAFSPIRISLFDQLGREVSAIYSGDLTPGTHTFMISSAELPSGMYYLRATGGNGLSAEKNIAVIK